MPEINRPQALVLGFGALAWLALLVILFLAPDLYDDELRPLGLAGVAIARLAFLAGITALLTIMAVGTLRRWRWAFWLLVLAMASGVLRIPVFALQALGVIPGSVPLWYAGLQAVVGIVQVLIAAAMLLGHRREGVWGAF